MKETIKVGYMGLGRRGYSVLDSCFSEMADVEVAAICDFSSEKLERAVKMLEDKGRPIPAQYADYHIMLQETNLDAVVIMTGWNDRLRCAMDAMEAGKYTAIEVGCAYDIDECYKLIETYERTGSPVMMLENCCYGRREMAALRMAKEGLFGEIVQCSGGYHHYLNRCELFHKDGTVDPDHYRLKEYAKRNCEQYPTHELGPISKVLNINRGNRMLSLRSFATKSVGLETFVRDYVPEDQPYHGIRFRQGDIVTTLIECAGGEQIQLVLDTTLPRAFYTRGFTVRGTKGMCQESTECACTFYLEGMPKEEAVFNNELEWYKEHDHPLHAEFSSLKIRGDHGGMDWLVIRAFVESVKNGTQTPIDVYDTATWLAIAPLSEASISSGGMPIPVPDFTKGKWFRREPVVSGKYSLDMICSDPDTPIYP